MSAPENTQSASSIPEHKPNPNHLTERQQQRFDQLQAIIDEHVKNEVEASGKMESAVAVHHGAVVPTPKDVDEVFPSLFIGGEKVARDIPKLTSLHLSHVVNCAEGPKFGQVNTGKEYYKESELQYLGLQAHDSVKFDMGVHFQSSADYIDKALNDGGKVYVHCHQGISRSTTIVLSYLMIYRTMDAAEALTQVLKHRLVYPNAGFLKRLIKLEDSLQASRLKATAD